MPSRLNAPVLTLDVAKMHEIDPRNVESLFGMWTVFNKCSQSIKDGSRLENMSWRIWARETLCCPPQPDKAIVPTLDVPVGRQSQVPSLSNSPASSDSGSDDEATEESPRRSISPQDDDDSALSKSRGKELHLTASALEKIVVTIHEKAALGPLSPSIEASLPALQPRNEIILGKAIEKQEEDQADTKMQNSTDSCISGATLSTVVTNTSRVSDHRNSDTSVSSDGLIRSGSVVHGFSPVSSSFRAKALQGLPVPSSKLAPASAKRSGMFQLGASSEDDESSFESKIQSFKRPHQRSSLSQSLTRQQLPNGLDKKKASFRDIVEQRRIHSDAENDEGAIASSDDEEDESAIEEEDDDDDGLWEDSPSEDDKPDVPQNYEFRRVDSRPELVSRPSVLSMALDQKRRASALQNEASRSVPAFRRSRTSSPQGPSMPGSPEENDEDAGLMMQGSGSRPRPIAMNTSNPSQGLAQSPRTTRRNMLSTELTESLRKNLLWERQQKSQTVNAFLKRSRNAMSMANLQEAGGRLAGQEQRSNSTLHQDLENPWEFNVKGW
jgi:Protein of unknown function (DUF3295)/Fungal protein of unknown function (DUF1752)